MNLWHSNHAADDDDDVCMSSFIIIIIIIVVVITLRLHRILTVNMVSAFAMMRNSMSTGYCLS